MLLDDKQKAVRLFADNVLRGRVQIVDLVDGVDKYHIDSMALSNKLLEWFNMEPHVEKEGLEREFTEITDRIYQLLVIGRIHRYVQGEMIDTDLEAELKQCKEDNKRLSEQLQVSYVPPRDAKVGTN